MPTYAKVATAMLDSSIWDEDDQTRIVWVTMLLMKDENGLVKAYPKSLAARARVSEAATKVALKKFLSPDPSTPGQPDEGRRIKEVEGGWMILNAAKYRNMGWGDMAKEVDRARKAEQRARSRASSNGDGEPIATLPRASVKEGPVAPPPGFPENEEAARMIATRAGVPWEFAEPVWNELVSVGYVDWKGNRVSRFENFLKAMWGKQVNRQAEQKARGNGAPGSKSLGTADRIGLENQLKRLQESKIKLKGEAEFYGPDAERDKKIKETAAKIQSIEATLDTIQP